MFTSSLNYLPQNTSTLFSFDYACPTTNSFSSQFYQSSYSAPQFFSDFSVPPINIFANNNNFNLNLFNQPNQSIFTPQAFQFNMPQLNFNSFSNSFTFPKLNFSSFTPTSSTTTLKVGDFDLTYWKKQGYNETMGKKLAQDAVRTCKYKADAGCVGYTRRTINRIYGTNFTNAGKAYQFGQNILSRKELKGKFKKINKSDIAKHGVPDGAIVLYAPGSRGLTKGAAARCGHGGIAYNNVTYSDVKFGHIETCQEIWIPI